MKNFIIIFSSVIILSLSSSDLNANDNGSVDMTEVHKAIDHVINACFSHAIRGTAKIVTTMKKAGMSDKVLDSESMKEFFLNYHGNLTKTCMQVAAYKVNEAADSIK